MPRIVREPLTKRLIDGAKALAAREGRRVRIWDSEVKGLGARVHPSGTVTWFVRYSRPGGGANRWQTYSLDDVDAAVPVAKVRQVAAETLRRVSGGTDLLTERRELREAKTVADLFPVWLDWLESGAREHGAAKESTMKEYRRLWKAEICHRLGSEPVRTVSPEQVRQLASDVRATPGRHTNQPRLVLANRVVARLREFFAWCIEEGHRPDGPNPAAKLVKKEKEPPTPRYLSPEQVAAVWSAIETAETVGLPVAPALKAKKRGAAKTARPSRKKPGARAYTLEAPREPRGSYRAKEVPAVRKANPVAVAALKMLVMSGWRESEVLTLRWEQIRWDMRQAHLPDTKAGRDIRELYDDRLYTLLETLPWRTSTGWVFPGRTAGEPLKEIRHLWYAVRHAAGVTTARLHDLRHTLASLALTNGATLAEVGELLGHRDDASTRRYAKLHRETVRTAQRRTLDAMFKPRDAAPSVSS